MGRGSGESYQPGRAGEDAELTPRGARRRNDSRRGGAGGPPEEPDQDESEVLSVGEVLAREQSAEGSVAPVPETPTAAENVATTPDTTSVESVVAPEGTPAVAPEPPTETPATATPAEAGFEPAPGEAADVETGGEPESAALSPLAEKRDAYAKALRSQSKILFGRTSKADLQERREEYQATIAEEVKKKIDEVKAEFGDGVPTDPAREAELNDRITDLVLTHRAEEENSLVFAMKESADHSAVQRFQRFWKQHTKARLFIGLGLLGGGIAATMTGQFAVAAGLQSLRVPLSGVGGAMTVESLAEMARSKWGKTGEMKSDEDIQSLDNDELERRLAAHESSFVDTGGKKFGAKVRGVKFLGVGKKRADTTGERLLQEYQSRHATGVKEMVTEYQDKGMTPDQIVAKVLEISLDEQRSHHAALEQRRASDRRFAIVKWTTAALGGAALAALSAGGALRQAGRAVEVGKDVTGGAGKAAGRLAASIHEGRGAVPDTAHVDTGHVHADTSHAAADTAHVADTTQAAAADIAHGAAPDSSEAAAYGAGQVEESVRQYHPDQGDGADTAEKGWSGLDRPVKINVDEAMRGSQVAQADSVTAHGAAPDTSHADTASIHSPAMPETTGVHQATAAADVTHVHTHADSAAAHSAAPDTSHAVAHADSAHTHDAAPDTSHAASHGAETGAATAAATAETVEVKKAGVEIVKKGDSLWKILERHLHDQMGPKFDGLDEARKTYMIDALKDRVVDNPGEFGLDNPDQLEIGQKLDLSHVFEGKDAADLGQIHDQAVALNQAAVDNITHNNELLREWVVAHPHEALHADEVLAAKASIASEPILSEHAREIWVRDVTEGMRERMLCDLAEKYPVEYAAAHAENPELYPDVATEHGEAADAATGETQPHIHLDHDAIQAQKKLANVTKEFYRSTLRPDADGIMKQVNDMTAGEILKKGVVEARIDQMEGGTHEWAKKLASAVQKLLKNIPADEYDKSEKLKEILARTQEGKG